MVLTFDGSELPPGEFNDVVKWFTPLEPNSDTIPTLLTLIQIDSTSLIPVYLRRCSTGDTIASLVDELKTTFSLIPIGTRRIKLRGYPRKIRAEQPWTKFNIQIIYQWSNYVIYPAEYQLVNGRIKIITNRPLAEFCWYQPNDYPEDTQTFLYELRKIFLFRQIVGLDPMTDFNVWVTLTSWPISINEFRVLEPGELPENSSMEMKLFPDPEIKADILRKMLRSDQSDQDTIIFLRPRLDLIIRRIEPNLIWLTDLIVDRVCSILLTTKK